MKPAITPQQKEFTDSEKSKLSLYKELAVGDVSALSFAYYEACNLFLSNLTGLAGFGLRSIFYPSLFKSCGKKSAFGRGMVIRNPAKISLGNKVLIDDYAALDVRGSSASIEISDYVCIGRYTTIAAKHGNIKLSAGANVGSYCRIATNSKVEIGESVLIGAYAYIGPGNHRQDEEGKSLIESSMDIKGGVKIGAHAWIGARATILDGVTIGEGAIIGAHSFVRDDVPAGARVAGTPARIIEPR